MKKLINLAIILFFINLTCCNREEQKPAVSTQTEVNVRIYKLTGESPNKLENLVGIVNFKDTEKGLLITPNLVNIAPGEHGFHIHENPSCAPGTKEGEEALLLGLGAGGHYDPDNYGNHLGPYANDGHLGDLPVLVASKDGAARSVTLAPRLKVADIINRSVVIHAGSDNYSDQPKALGGGGARVYCGVISQ